MAASMLVLLFTSFLPIVGIRFAWVTIHWIAGVVLTLSVLYHMIHASFWLNFWSIWPTLSDLDDASKRVRLALVIRLPLRTNTPSTRWRTSCITALSRWPGSRRS